MSTVPTPTQHDKTQSLDADRQVSEQAFEFLLAELFTQNDIESESHRPPGNSSGVIAPRSQRPIEGTHVVTQEDATVTNVTAALEDISLQEERSHGSNDGENSEHQTNEEHEYAIMASERSAAKLERLGYDVGYRLIERVAQTKPWPSDETLDSVSVDTESIKAKRQLEAVKFICKEFWIVIFQKKIDKLQTNNRGTFMLQDHEFKWLKRLSNVNDDARVAAVKLLTFPCGIIRGALVNLGYKALVSCDFAVDGTNIASCSFHIKIQV